MSPRYLFLHLGAEQCHSFPLDYFSFSLLLLRLLSCFSHVHLLATPWTAAHHGIFQARVLEWVAIAFSAFSLYLAKFFRFHQKVLSQLPKLGLNALPVFPKTLCPYPYHNTYDSIL